MANEAYESIDEIVDVSGGANVTFGAIIKNFNKNIRTCINAIKNNKNVLNNRVLGLYNSQTINVNVPKGESKIYSIHISNDIYTHGYVKSSNSSWNTLWLELNKHKNSATETTTKYNLTFELVNNDEGTTINIEIWCKSVNSATDIIGTLTIEYELY